MTRLIPKRTCRTDSASARGSRTPRFFRGGLFTTTREPPRGRAMVPDCLTPIPLTTPAADQKILSLGAGSGPAINCPTTLVRERAQAREIPLPGHRQLSLDLYTAATST
jgi:hypothetical protein